MENYQALLQEIETCQACPLCQARTNVVPGDGNLQAKIMFIGEGPGAEEDKRGIPFVGAAGQLLDQMLDTIGLRRERCIHRQHRKMQTTGQSCAQTG